MTIHVGTSGWTYDDWNGEFYPKGVRGAARLGYYASRFSTVEVNATFYRFPSARMIAAWNRVLPPGFAMAVKGTRTVTHFKKLEGCQDLVADFMARVMDIGALQVVLWQLPPSMGKDLYRLARFLDLLPDQVSHCVEFRHPSWWDHDVASLLGERSVAFVAVSHPRLPDEIVDTSGLVYVRFHGLGPKPYEYDYTPEELRPWVEGLGPHLAASRDVFAFFNNDYHANAVRNATWFREALEAAANGEPAERDAQGAWADPITKEPGA